MIVEKSVLSLVRRPRIDDQAAVWCRSTDADHRARISAAHFPSARLSIMWRLTAKRCLSSPAIAKKKIPKDPVDMSALPTRHSRKLMPRACLDRTERADLTQQLLESTSLFSYRADKNEAEDAWLAADPAVQLAEYVVRGYAASVPGTTLFRFLPKKADDCEDPFTPMTQIMDKLWEEGRTYMTLRETRLKEVASINSQQSDESSSHGALLLEDLDGPNELLKTEMNHSSDFASPGLTVNMYNHLLDSMACAQPNAETAVGWFEAAKMRYQLDGGDEKNVNPCTKLDVMTYNACIRIAANSDERDDSMLLAFTVFDSFPERSRNSSTYENIIRVIGKHVPVCRSRGNMAFGMLEHARQQGVWSHDVVDAYLQANTPSNGPEFEEYIEKYFRDKKLEDFPLKFRGKASVMRHDRRDPVY